MCYSYKVPIFNLLIGNFIFEKNSQSWQHCQSQPIKNFHFMAHESDFTLFHDHSLETFSKLHQFYVILFSFKNYVKSCWRVISLVKCREKGTFKCQSCGNYESVLGETHGEDFRKLCDASGDFPFNYFLE